MGDVGLIPGLGPGGGRGTHSSGVESTGESPWTEEPGGLQSMGSQRVRHDRETKHTDKYHVVQTMEYGSALKRNELSSYEKTWE